jgi:hypothetical protein
MGGRMGNTSEYNRKYYQANKEKRKQQFRKYREENAEYFRNYMREYQLKNKDALSESRRAWRYGMTVDEMNERLEEAGDICPICHAAYGTETTKKCIDHCHETGEIRGIICNKCNIAAGMLQDDVQAVKRLAEYLES